MPYIDQDIRTYLAPELNAMKRRVCHKGIGVLNYTITQLLIAWLGDTPNYHAFNGAIGVLECAKLELYRRMVAPYEDVKRGESGDVFP